MVCLLQQYPVGELIYLHHKKQLRLTDGSESSLISHHHKKQRTSMLTDDLESNRQVLGSKLLEDDRYLDQLTQILDAYYKTMAQKTCRLLLRVDSADCKQKGVTAIQTYAKLHVIESASHAAGEEPPIPDLNSVQPKKTGDALLLLEVIIQHSNSLVDHIECRLKSFSEKTVKSLMMTLKLLLVDLAKCLEVILSHYTSYCFKGTSLPEFEKVQDALKQIIEHLNPDSLSSLFPEQFKTCQKVHPEHVLCSILGLQARCADMLRDMPEEDRNHQTDEYWLLKQLENNWIYKVLECEDLSTCQELVMLGFTQSRAELLAEYLDEDPIARDHQTTLYWAERCIENAFKYDILLNSAPRYRYPYGGDDPVGVWSEKRISTNRRIWSRNDEVTPAVPSTLRVRYINLVDQKDTRYTTRDGVKYPQKSNNRHSIFFHTTDHASAVSIVEKGINLGCGKRRQDFSDGYGFYLNCDFDYALKFCWRAGRFGAPPAIIVFKVPNDVMAEFTELDLESRANWTNIVRYCRTGAQEELSTSYSNADYVQGAICTNARDAVNKGPDEFIPVPLRHVSGVSRDQFQVCIKKEKMAKAFGDIRNVDGVLFF